MDSPGLLHLSPAQLLTTFVSLAVPPIFLVSISAPIVLACNSINDLPASFDSYPDCAAACLACNESSYTHNFINNCDYDDGECCTSAHHLAIAESWACVRQACQEPVAREAFRVFVQECKEKDKPLDEVDVPDGLSLEDSTEEEEGNGGQGSQGLDQGELIGVIFGALGAFAAIIGAFFGWRRWKHSRQNKQDQTAMVVSDRSDRRQIIRHIPPEAYRAAADQGYHFEFVENPSVVSLSTNGFTRQGPSRHVYARPSNSSLNSRAVLGLPMRTVEEVPD
ncbi:hypothetical protein MKZ38_009633 [Zalerion maritima]|uniref:Extracellular membrane protein CFEM domain-containing protein n=1 Tax=Zalerion maritima TaxID=339359 RepID=A0AAD5RUH7_9PEZI|nr:hypothetical protein MKZ38_009633 [Zalerion maritima]